ncbi:MAG: ATP-binding cassette domain-containing protein [Acidimicrobiales bacterium]|jgi:ABC-2 type transport system ATP-binding protein
MPDLIEARGLVKRFRKVVALDGLDLRVPAGQVTAVLGPNGAGKTTFVRAVATLLRPDAGRLNVLGHDTARDTMAVRRLIGLAGQSAAVEPTMTGRENLVMVARLYGRSRKEARQRAADVLERIGLAASADRPVKTYSGGMRRRLDLGASLVGAPRLLVMDEPTTGLDPRSRTELWDAIRDLAASGTEVLLTTQYLDEADQLAQRVVIVEAGKVIAEGTPAELKSRVGLDRIEVHTRDAAGAATAATVLAALGAEGDGVEVDLAMRRASVPCSDGPGLLPAATAGLVAAGVEIEDLTLRRPTLDEVFMALTGHHTQSPGSEGEKGRPKRAHTEQMGPKQMEGALR